MSTRINISIVDPDAISELNKLRENLEQITKKRLSLAEIVCALIKTDGSTSSVIQHLS